MKRKRGSRAGSRVFISRGAESLRAWRDANNKALADVAGFVYGDVGKWHRIRRIELGERQPDATELVKIQQLIDCRISDFAVAAGAADATGEHASIPTPTPSPTGTGGR